MFKESVLVVDDEKTILELARRFLSGEGYQVEVASNGMDALKLIGEKPFQILLTDVRMPGMSGLELMKMIRPAHPDVIIVVITGHGTVSTAIESLKLGAMGFILKPFTHKELLSVVEHATQKTRLTAENLRMRSLMPLFEINRNLLHETDPEALLNRSVQMVLAETHADRVSLLLLNDTGDRLVRKGSAGFSSPDEEDRLLEKLKEEVVDQVMAAGKPMIFPSDGADHPEIHRWLGEQNISSALSLPLVHRKKVIGVLNLFKHGKATAFTESDLELGTILCGQVAVALENARLYQAIQDNHLRTLQALVAAIEVKDLFSRGHSSNVAKFTSILGKNLGLSKPQIQELIISSLLHDIGKIGSSDEILAKADQLTEEERTEMKEHPTKAIQILTPIGLSETVVASIRHHHEWWDGTGYPDRLAGEAIPPYARLIAVADALDTLLADRPYRKAVSFAEALREIQSWKGRQFEPRLVDLLGSIDPKHFLQPMASTDLLCS